jgi:hypothetical protein
MAEKKKVVAEELEVRGFLTTGCNQCPFVRQTTGGYGDMEILGYYCGLYNKEFPNPDWDDRHMSGCKNSVPKGFPKFCRLKKVTDQSATILQRYKRVVDELCIIMRIIDD